MPVLSRHTGVNKAGICTIHLAIACDVTGLPVYDGRGTLNHNSFASFSSQFYTTYHTTDTAQHIQSEKQNQNGTFFSQNLTFKVPKDRIDVLKVLRAYKNKKLIAIATYKNGNQKIIGTKEYPLQLNSTIDSGKIHTDFNHYQFSLTGNTKYASPAVYYFQELPPADPNIITLLDTNPIDNIAEEENTSNTATYTISRVQGDSNTTSVNIVLNGIAPIPISASDAKLQYQDAFMNWYDILSGTVAIEANQNEVQIRLVAIDDSVYEGTETFEIVISNPSNNATIQNDTVTGSILEAELPPILAVISLEFSGNFAGNTQVVSLNEKITFSFANIFSLAATYIAKYSDTNVPPPDWSLVTSQSLANIQTAIDNGSDIYLLYFEVQTYTSFPKAVLTLSYLTFNPVPSVQVVQMNQVSQSTWIGLPSNITVQLASIVSANAPVSIFHFGFKTSANDDFTLYDLDLAGLNALLLSTADSIERMIIFYSEYQAPNVSDTPILIFN